MPSKKDFLGFKILSGVSERYCLCFSGRLSDRTLHSRLPVDRHATEHEDVTFRASKCVRFICKQDIRGVIELGAVT